MGVMFWINVIITAVSFAYQQSQQKKMRQKMEAEAEKRKGFKFSVSGEVGHLPVVYGKQVLGGFQTLHKTRSSYNNASKPGDVFTNGNWGGGRSGSKNEFLLVQAALCQDGIEGCVYAKVNDKPYNYIEKSDDGESNSPYDNIISVVSTGGVANPIATANGVNSNNLFTSTAYATMIYKLDRDEPQYQGVPDNSFFVKGRKVRTVNSSGVLSTSYTYSNNPAWCLLDYLLGDFGRGLDLANVDLYSFYRAALLCDTIVSYNRAIGGRINGIKPIKELSTLSVFPSEGDDEFIYKAEDTGVYYNWNGSSFVTTTVPNRHIPLYECNIALDSEATIRDNIERIMGTMGLAELIWTSTGKYKLILDYPASQAALNTLVNAQHFFTEDDIIRENVSIAYPTARERYNRVTVRFDNEHEDFKDDSMSWPELNGTVHLQYLSEDNNQPMTTDMFVDGITDPYHALAKAEQTVRQSRTVHYLTFTAGKKALSVEPGDFINVTIPQSGIVDSVYRVESIKISADLTVELKCYYFDYTSLAWNINDDIPYGNPPFYDFVVPTPSNIVVEPVVYTAPDGTIYSSLEVTWDASDSVSVNRYEVQWKKSTEVEYRSAFTKNTNYVIQNVEPNVEYDVRIRAVTPLGTNSAFFESTSTNFGKDIPPNPPTSLSAIAGVSYIKLDWVLPADADLSSVEIHESSDANVSNAVKIGEVYSNQFIRSNLPPQQRRYYWVRSVDTTGNLSEFVGPANDITTRISAIDIAESAVGWANLDSEMGTIYNQYTVTLDDNGGITGYQLVSDATQTSAFNVRADQFNLYDVSGNDYPIFSVRTTGELVNGTFFPAGAYVNGYLSADNLVADTLSSIVADIGTVTAGIIQSADTRMVMNLTDGTLIIKDTSNNIRVKLGNL